MRRNLSGIYIFDQFEDDEKRTPTCIEDCQESTRRTWLETLDKEALITTIDYLCQTLRGIGDQFDIMRK